MTVVDSVLDSLRKAEREVEAQLAGIKAAIASLGGGSTGRRGRKAAGASRRRRSKMSAEGRARIVAAQKARWAKVRAAQKK